ncbi:hypothetical protein [Rhodoferax sp. BAB1]|uniref:hypothetical protein n=1 Tax=Rhodoferax sp. BAB1 TaxID=2741720 RepID=UPI001576DE3B|nr:hypothetical protein [Rhodoferax sp. BAB1]QKO21935.1 hypothetical protein HTY51_08540 [Rhodoferax sp. BAB1]
MVTPNYGYEKRQKELAKKRKKEEKLKEKAQRKLTGQPEDGSPAEDDAEPTSSDAPDAGQGTQA